MTKNELLNRLDRIYVDLDGYQENTTIKDTIKNIEIICDMVDELRSEIEDDGIEAEEKKTE